MTNCPVCLESYAEMGDTVPRILPCHHTACGQCITQLLGGQDRVECPECKASYAAPEGTKTFPQNKYILNHIRKLGKNEVTEKRENPEGASQEEVLSASGAGKMFELDLCSEHGKKLSFYCKEEACKKFICEEDLLSSHKSHDFIGALDESERRKKEKKVKRQLLLKNLDAALEDVGKIKDNVVAVQKKVKKSSSDTLQRIRLRKEMVMRDVAKHFDNLYRETKEKMEKVDEEAETNVESLNERVKLLEELKQSVLSSVEVEEQIKKFNDIAKTDLEDIVSLEFSEYQTEDLEEDDFKMFLGEIETNETDVENEELFRRVRARHAATHHYTGKNCPFFETNCSLCWLLHAKALKY